MRVSGSLQHPAPPRLRLSSGSVSTPSGSSSATTKDAKYGFGRLIDLARAKPVTVGKHGRPVVVVMAVEEFDRLKSLETAVQSPERKAKT